MRCRILSVVSVMLILSEGAVPPASATANSQLQNSAQEKAASLRAQLAEVEAKQSELQTRLRTLEEKLKPENIENALAGVGSTHPEDLREQRRRQLEIERNGVRTQLDLLATSHSRLETAIAQADADAYRQSAAPVTTSSASASPTTTSSTRSAITPERPNRVKKKRVKKSRRMHHQQTT
ncbi:MAG TPA: hypothetical protein VGJ66_22895 [Pyrinomonadaceae bacterium]|jgi:hypothetical protein